MFSHIIPQRPSMDIIRTRKNSSPQMNKHHFSIAVGIALSCFAVQAQAAQTYNELPIPETAPKYDNDGLVQGAVQPSMTAKPVTTTQKRQMLVDQQAKLFFDCTQVQTSAARLACFDKVAAEGATPSYVNNKQAVDLAKTFKTTISGNPQFVFSEENTTITSANNNASDVVANGATTDGLDTVGLTQREAEVLEDVGVSQTDIENIHRLACPMILIKIVSAALGQFDHTARPIYCHCFIPLIRT